MSRAASGTRASTDGHARTSVSWPLRATMRDTQTTTGRPAEAVAVPDRLAAVGVGAEGARVDAGVQPGHPGGGGTA